MIIRNARIRRNGDFLNAIYNGQSFMEFINPKNPKESSKNLLRRIIAHSKKTE